MKHIVLQNFLTSPPVNFLNRKLLVLSFSLLFFSLAHTAINAQSDQVKGKVTNENNEGLPGVTITIKGTAKEAKIDGIGTQMHISISTSYSSIDYMFQALAATGLKVRISELDVRVNPTDKPNFDIATSVLAANYQAAMYEYVVKSYLKYVPAAQRHGITIWGVSDKDSWIVAYQKKIDAPLLFDKTYAKKPAYSAVLQALKAQ